MFFFRVLQFRVNHIQFPLVNRRPAKNHQLFSHRVVFRNPLGPPEPDQLQASGAIRKISDQSFSPSFAHRNVALNFSFDLDKGQIGTYLRYFIELAPVHITVRIVG